MSSINLSNEAKRYNALKGDTPNTIVFGFPRSGSTLLMRLMDMACSTPTKGDYPLKFYQGYMMMRKSLMGDGFFGPMIELESNNIFPDTYRGRNPESFAKHLYDYYLHHLFIGGTGGSFTKCTILGFGNDDLVPFVEMIRESFSGEHHRHGLKVVFLTRNKEDAALSLWNKTGHIYDSTEEQYIANTIGLLEFQHEQMKEASEFGDVWIDYKDIITEPIKTLLKLQPSYYPDEIKVNQILERRIS